MDADELVARCGRAVAVALEELLGDGLVAAWLIGSGALGGVSAVQSDVDVVAVCAAPLAGEVERALVPRLEELAMTWPLRGLELVLYTRAAVAAPARVPRWELNLTVGRGMDHHLSRDPATDPPHWFVLDLDILRGHGRTLAGPPPAEVVGPIPRRRVLEAVRDSLRWHGEHEPNLSQSVLNACRGWRFTTEGEWSSKRDAGAWAVQRTGDPGLIDAALAVRAGDRSRPLDPDRVAAFTRRVLERVERELEP
ncbi:MAG TPA: aminoglycoside adenylyltransferase domain-containing protein [Actinomycetes bacterium]|nr:aminoglycoside adenylyltransferase domain-containing protein [Actinomycetes bacterium]